MGNKEKSETERMFKIKKENNGKKGGRKGGDFFHKDAARGKRGGMINRKKRGRGKRWERDEGRGQSDEKTEITASQWDCR